MNPVEHWVPQSVQIVVEALMFFKWGFYVLLGLRAVHLIRNLFTSEQ